MRKTSIFEIILKKLFSNNKLSLNEWLKGKAGLNGNIHRRGGETRHGKGEEGCAAMKGRNGRGGVQREED